MKGTEDFFLNTLLTLMVKEHNDIHNHHHLCNIMTLLLTINSLWWLILLLLIARNNDAIQFNWAKRLLGLPVVLLAFGNLFWGGTHVCGIWDSILILPLFYSGRFNCLLCCFYFSYS